jgi:hypothetical protein
VTKEITEIILQQGHADDVAVQMLDYEANKDLPDEAHASAMFFRLMLPMLSEACATVANKYGNSMVLECIAGWVGTMTAGVLVPQVPTMPREDFAQVIKGMTAQFNRSAMVSVDEFVKLRDGEGGNP